MEEISSKVKKAPINKKSLIINLVIIAIVTGLSVFYMVRNRIFDSFYLLSNIPWYGFITFIILMILVIMSESFLIYRSFKETNPLSYKESVGAYLYGNLGSSISPAKAAHFPFKAFYYGKKKKSFDEILNSMTQIQIICSFVMIVIYLTMFIVASIMNFQVKLLDREFALKWFALIGVGFNVLFAAIFIVLGFVPPINKFVINIIAWILLKLKKIKTKEEYTLKEINKMQVYKKQIIYLATHFYKAIPSILIYSVSVIIRYGLPYIVYLFISHDPFRFDQLILFMSLTQCMSYMTNVIPVPGGTGVLEFTFLTVFSSFILNEGVRNATMITWRIFSYYTFLVVDIIFFIIDMVVTSRKDIHLDNEVINKVEKKEE